MPKMAVDWSPQARADLRAIDRETALQILRGIDRYLSTGAGDVKKLQLPRREFRVTWATACCCPPMSTRGFDAARMTFNNDDE
jgi:hypothetical protein